MEYRTDHSLPSSGNSKNSKVCTTALPYILVVMNTMKLKMASAMIVIIIMAMFLMMRTLIYCLKKKRGGGSRGVRHKFCNEIVSKSYQYRRLLFNISNFRSHTASFNNDCPKLYKKFKKNLRVVCITCFTCTVCIYQNLNIKYSKITYVQNSVW
jgi:hypothetical protein